MPNPNPPLYSTLDPNGLRLLADALDAAVTSPVSVAITGGNLVITDEDGDQQPVCFRVNEDNTPRVALFGSEDDAPEDY